MRGSSRRLYARLQGPSGLLLRAGAGRKATSDKLLFGQARSMRRFPSLFTELDVWCGAGDSPDSEAALWARLR
jgi:hypothetical protein